MRYLLFFVLSTLLIIGCSDEETIVPSDIPEFKYTLPQGNHDYDDRIVDWNKRCGFFILYKFEPKDVFFNRNLPWEGMVTDTIVDDKGNISVDYDGYIIDPADEEYAGKQLAWIEEMFLNHYPDSMLKVGMVHKLILARNLTYGGSMGLSSLDFVNSIFASLIFNYGDASITTLSRETKKAVKDAVNKWFLCSKLIAHTPNLDEFFSVTDYEYVKSAANWDYYWKGWIAPRVPSMIGEMYQMDLEYYLEMIVTTPYKDLIANPVSISVYSGFGGCLHPRKDEAGLIQKKYDILVKAYKSIGIDLEAIGNQYSE